MGLLPLTYTRPKHVDRDSWNTSSGGDSSCSDNEKSDGSVKSGQSGQSTGIPDSLAFDKIINGGTCPVSFSVRYPPIYFDTNCDAFSP